MANTIYLAPLQNYITKTLNGAIDASQTTITLSTTTNLQAPGVVVVDRVDSSGNVLATSLREVIYYTGISGSDLTGCTRGGDGSTGQIHSSGAVVETMPTVGMWNGLATIVGAGLDGSGYLRAINSPVSIARGEFTQVAIPSIASITQMQGTNIIVGNVTITNSLNLSNASITGPWIFPTFRTSGAYSGPTIGIGGILSAPKAGNLQWVSVVTPRVASGASVVFDFMNNGTSIFAGVTKPTIVGGGTYVSTASINTKAFGAGAVLRGDIATLSSPGVIQDFTIQGGTL